MWGPGHEEFQKALAVKDLWPTGAGQPHSLGGVVGTQIGKSLAVLLSI